MNWTKTFERAVAAGLGAACAFAYSVSRYGVGSLMTRTILMIGGCSLLIVADLLVRRGGKRGLV